MNKFLKNQKEADSLNNESPANQNVGLGDAIKTASRETAVVGTYDFGVEAGAISEIALKDPQGDPLKIPAGSIVKSILSNEISALTSGGSATVQVKAGSTDLTGAIAFDTGFAGVDDQALDGSAEGLIVAAEETVTVDIAVAALTAGKVEFYISLLRNI